MSFIFDPIKADLIYKKLSKSITEPKTELIYKNHFQLLIAVMLTAQTTDKIVNEITPALFKKYPNPNSLINFGEIQLAKFIKRIGLAPTKAKNIIHTCKIILEVHSGAIPKTREEIRLEAIHLSAESYGEQVYEIFEDNPGALKELVDEISSINVNIVEVLHDRLSSEINAGSAGVTISLETEDQNQSNELINHLRDKNIEFQVIS